MEIAESGTQIRTNQSRGWVTRLGENTSHIELSARRDKNDPGHRVRVRSLGSAQHGRFSSAWHCPSRDLPRSRKRAASSYSSKSEYARFRRLKHPSTAWSRF